MKKKILFVIVIYNQSFFDSNTYKTLISCNSDVSVYIYDNSFQSYYSCVNYASNIFYFHDEKKFRVEYCL